MNWLTIIFSLISAVIGGTIVAYVNYRYNKKFEIESRQITQAAKTAPFFAKWMKYNGKAKEILDKQQLYDYYEELNKGIFELSLWIKDKKLLMMIKDALTNKPNAPDIKEIFIETRKRILGKKSGDLTVDDLVHFKDP